MGLAEGRCIFQSNVSEIEDWSAAYLSPLCSDYLYHTEIKAVLLKFMKAQTFLSCISTSANADKFNIYIKIRSPRQFTILYKFMQRKFLLNSVFILK